MVNSDCLPVRAEQNAEDKILDQLADLLIDTYLTRVKAEGKVKLNLPKPKPV